MAGTDVIPFGVRQQLVAFTPFSREPNDAKCPYRRDRGLQRGDPPERGLGAATSVDRDAGQPAGATGQQQDRLDVDREQRARGLHRWFHRRWHRVQEHELGELGPDQPPALQTDGTIAANDNFNKKKDPVTFYYTVNVHFTVVPAGGTDQTFPYDPDIQNEGGGNRLVKAAG